MGSILYDGNDVKRAIKTSKPDAYSKSCMYLLMYMYV